MSVWCRPHTLQIGPKASVPPVAVSGSLLHVSLSLGKPTASLTAGFTKVSTIVREGQTEGSHGLTIQVQKQHPSPPLYQLNQRSLWKVLTAKGMHTEVGGIASRHFGELPTMVSQRISSLLSPTVSETLST